MTKRDDAKLVTRGKLIEAARQAFAAEPYEAVTIRDLAARAGMSTGAIFASFAGKAELYTTATGLTPPNDRGERQRTVAEWCAAAFGADQATDPAQRGLRHLEEAGEAYQRAAELGGLDPVVARAKAHKLLDYIFDRPAGDMGQEIGGSALTLLALAEAVGLNADVEERREIARVLSKPLAEFTARNEAKNVAGFNVLEAAR